jgi:GNAT superfamily N-acetyltransferase
MASADPAVTLRDARRADYPGLSALALRSKGHWGYAPAMLAAMREELTWTVADAARGVFRIAEVDGVLAGFHAVLDLESGAAELEALFVDPPFIGTGIGRRLMDDAADCARRRGARRLVIQGDPNAEAFYRAAGAVRRGTRPSASLPGRDLPLLELDLSR